jgi:hypothetical protein
VLFRSLADKNQQAVIAEGLKNNISDAQLAEVYEKIKQLKSIEFSKIKPVNAGSPDTDYALKNLRTEISKQLQYYIKTMSEIDMDIQSEFSKIYAAEAMLPQNLLAQETQRIIVGLNERLNAKYRTAIANLYLTDYPVYLHKKNIFKQKVNLYSHYVPAHNKGEYIFGKFHTYTMPGRFEETYNPVTPAGNRNSYYSVKTYKDCKTSFCMNKLNQAIVEWLKIVEVINQPINFSNLNIKKTYLSLGQNPTSATISYAMADAADKLLSQPKNNTQYNIASYLLEYIKMPAGALIGMAGAPVFLFEKAARFSVNLASLKLIKVNLAIESVDAYKIKDIEKDMGLFLNEYVQLNKIPALLYGDELTREAQNIMKASQSADEDKK